MGRKEKVPYEKKVQACEDYINGIASAPQLAEKLGLGKRGKDKIFLWVKKYRVNGKESLKHREKNNSYTKEFKLQVVEEYLSGEGSINSLCIKHQIPSHETLRSWIVKYNRHEELGDYIPKPEVYKMAYRKKTTQQEREEIVNYCIEHNKDYKKTASVYGVSYSQVYSWVRKYFKNGVDGLSDKRGRRKEEMELTELEILQRQNKILEAKIKELEMETELLKKVKEIERRRYSRSRKTK